MRYTCILIILLTTSAFFPLLSDAKQEDKVELIISDPKKAEGSWGKEADVEGRRSP
jgi:hypothetical protein